MEIYFYEMDFSLKLKTIQMKLQEKGKYHYTWSKKVFPTFPPAYIQ